MKNPIYNQILVATSQSLNMTRQHLIADTRRLAEYWEVALEQGNIDNVNTAILFLDTGIHGYLKAKGIDLGNKTALKKDQFILNSMILLISMYVLDRPNELFPVIHRLTPLAEQEWHDINHREGVLEMAEKILREKNESNN
jgi:hypothetical protein